MNTNENHLKESEQFKPPESQNLEWVEISVDGEVIRARRGETLATAFWKAGRRTMRHSLISDAPRGMYCGMGVCYDCVLTVNGKPFVRACMTKVEPDLQVETNDSWIRS